MAIYFVLSSFYIGLWYARTRHQGSPLSEVIIEAIMVAAPLSAWATVGLWWLIHRRRTAFSRLYATRTETPALDVGLGPDRHTDARRSVGVLRCGTLEHLVAVQLPGRVDVRDHVIDA